MLHSFIDAEDTPPTSCSVDFNRDCTTKGCSISAIQNYTSRVQDSTLSAADQTDALKFLIHFLGDITQPLHDEAEKVGGNGIKVTWNGKATNLHHTWYVSFWSFVLSLGTILWVARHVSEVQSGFMPSSCPFDTSIYA